MLGRRLISAAVIISVTILLLCIDFWLGTALSRPGLVVCLLCTVAAAMAASELVAMLANVTNRTNQQFVVAATVAMMLVTCAPVWWKEYPVDCELGHFGWGLSGFVLAVVLSFAYEMLNYRTPIGGAGKGEVTDRLGRNVLVFGYLAMCFGFLVPHRFLHNGNGYGILTLVTLVATVKLSDSFAYFAGKRFGTIKLAPQLSPGKTLQGSLGAPVGGCIAAAICVFIVAPVIFGTTINKPWWWFLVYGIVVTAAGMVGDLAESLIKRDCNTKDSSSWLPGLGGVLDILDSLIFAAPVSYFLWIIAELPAQSAN